MKVWMTLLLVSIGIDIRAQPVSETINVNSIEAVVSSNGALFWDLKDGQFNIQNDNGVTSTMRSSGLWMAGLDERGFLHGAIQKYNEGGTSDFMPGVLDGQGQPINEVNQIWKVTKEDINAHIEDYDGNGMIDNPLPSIFGYPGHRNAFFEDYNDFALPGGLGQFQDINNNGIYEPDFGEYPVIGLRGCRGFVPDEMLTYVFHDVKVHTESQFLQLKVSVFVNVFAFECQENPILNNTIFANFRIINRGTEQLDSFHMAVFSDFDIGCAEDDYVGCYPDQSVYFGYNGNEVDAGCSNAFSRFPPVQATTILRYPFGPKIIGANGELLNPEIGQPFDTISSITPSAFVPFGYDQGNMGDPSDVDHYNYLGGYWKDGTPMSDNKIFFNGDPSDPSARSEVSEGNTPGDRRMIATMGPFRYDPGIINEVLVAYSAYRDSTVGYLENVSLVYEKTEKLHEVHDNCFQDPCSFLVGSLTEPAPSVELSISPNPSNGEFVLEYSRGERFQILDLTGKVLFAGTLNGTVTGQSSRHEFRVDHLKRGVYLLKVTGKEGFATIRFVKN